MNEEERAIPGERKSSSLEDAASLALSELGVRRTKSPRGAGVCLNLCTVAFSVLAQPARSATHHTSVFPDYCIHRIE